MGKRLCAPSPSARAGASWSELAVKVESSLGSAGQKTGGPEIVRAAIASPGSCAGGEGGSRGCFTEHAALPTDRDLWGWLRRLKKRQADAANNQPSSRMQSVGARCLPRPTKIKTASEWSPRSMEDTENRRFGRDPSKLPDGIGQASPEPENRMVGGVARGGGMDRPPPDPGLLFKSYRWARSSSRRLVNGSAFSAKSRARCAKPR